MSAPAAFLLICLIALCIALYRALEREWIRDDETEHD